MQPLVQPVVLCREVVFGKTLRTVSLVVRLSLGGSVVRGFAVVIVTICLGPPPCREKVKNAVLDVFAGPPHTGAYSPSVQVI